MMIFRTASRFLLVTLGVGAFLLSGPPAWAQKDPTASPAIKNPPPAKGPLSGRPETSGAQALAPNRPGPFPTPADKLPLSRIKAPPGFKVEVYASGVKNARAMRIGDKSTLFVGNWQANKVWAVVNKNGKRTAKVLYE